MKKKTIITIMLAAILATPQPSRSVALPLAICIGGAAAAGVIGVAIIVHTCRPRYYCIIEPDTELKWCKQTTRKQANLEGLTVISGPYDDTKSCGKLCVTNASPVPTLDDYVEPKAFLIEKSTDLVHWTTAADLTGIADPEDFEWRAEPDAATCFYRVKLTYGMDK